MGSPTFTVSRVYSASNSLSIHHFDFYRLADPGIVSLELQEILHDNSAIIVIEWGEMIESVLPQKKLIVTFVRTGENTRQLTISYPKELSYVLEDDVK